MTREEVVAFMESSKSDEEWNANCDTIKKAHDGSYPPYWFEAILQSGLASRVAAGWGEWAGITVTAVDRDGTTEGRFFPLPEAG